MKQIRFSDEAKEHIRAIPQPIAMNILVAFTASPKLALATSKSCKE